MLLNLLGLLPIAIGYALADATSSSDSTPNETASAPSATHTVAVGADGLNFTPHELTAEVGDIIEYRFYPQNHSVAKGAFGNQPCIPYELTGPGRVGFWSGFKPIQVVTNDLPSYRIQINDTDPLFVYCSAPGSCLQGMVAVINPNSTFTWEAQFNYTQNATVTLSPGESFPLETPKSRPSGLDTAPSVGTSAAAQQTTSSSSSGSSGHAISGGAIAGIVIAAVVVCALAGALIYMCGRHKSAKEQIMRQSQPPPPAHSSYQPSSPGLSEAQYSTIAKSPIPGTHTSTNSYGVPGTKTESFRSMSPPMDERSQMMGMTSTMHYPAEHIPHPGSPDFMNPSYPQELDPTTATIKSSHADETQPDVHELAAPGAHARHPSVGDTPVSRGSNNRPFSFAGSESGYKAGFI